MANLQADGRLSGHTIHPHRPTPGRPPKRCDSSLIRIVAADAQPIFLAGLSALAGREQDIQIVAESSNGPAALEQVRALGPDITLLDQQLPGTSGIETLREIRRHFPQAKVILLTTHASDVLAQQAFQAGAMGFVLKSTIHADLVDTIRAVHNGMVRVDPDIAQRVAHHLTRECLSRREIQILQLIAHGATTKKIAFVLSISEGTVKTHVRSFLDKLGARHRPHAVLLGLTHGIINP